MGIRFTANEIEEGMQFGELAMANNEPRAATVVAIQDCEFFTVEKEDYTAILKSVHKKETEEKLYLFRHMPQLSTFRKEDLYAISASCQLQRYAQHTVILQQAASPNTIVIIKSGTCRVIKALSLDSQSPVSDTLVDVECLHAVSLSFVSSSLPSVCRFLIIISLILSLSNLLIAVEHYSCLSDIYSLTSYVFL